MAKIYIQLAGKDFTMSDLEYFKGAVEAASDYSNEELSIKLGVNQLSVSIETEEK